MKKFSRLWNKLPVLLRAILTGFVVLLAGNLPWTILLVLNTKILPVLPWSSIVMIIYLWLLYKYLNGKWKPAGTSLIRKEYLRAKHLKPKILTWSLVTLLLAQLSLSFFSKLYIQLLSIKIQSPLPDLSQFNTLFITCSIFMISIVAGVVEEAAFRGYMQVPLEKKFGIAAAVIIVGFMFGLAHFTHAGMSLSMVPIFIASSVIYGLMAYTTESIIPGIILHSFGDALQLMLLWQTGETLTSGINNQFTIMFLAIVLLITSIITYKKLRYEILRKM